MKTKEEIQQESGRMARECAKGLAMDSAHIPLIAAEILKSIPLTDLLTARAERDELKKRDALELIADQNKKLRAELERVKAQPKGPFESRTYGDLPVELTRLIEAHEWDNKNAGEQRDWLIEQWLKLRSQVDALMKIAVAANSDAPIPNRLDDIEKAITAAQEQGIEIK